MDKKTVDRLTSKEVQATLTLYVRADIQAQLETMTQNNRV